MQARSSSNVKIIDVSHHQGTIDWNKVKADGVMGVFIKATEGTSYKDPMLATNAKGALEAGLKVGYYHYSHPEQYDALSEATYFASVIASYKTDFPHVLDVEGNASSVPSSKLTDWCAQWLTAVKQQTGQDTMLYTGASFAKTYLGKSLGQWPLWVAHYGVDKPMDNGTWDKWAAFQYTSTGKVNGIAGNVDMDAMESDFYNKYAGTPIVKPQNPLDTVKVVVNDKLASYGRNLNGTVYTPLRQLGESLGATVAWDSTLKQPTINGLPIPASHYMMLEGNAYVSVRTAGNYLGGTVSWESKNQKVYIYY